MFRIFYLVVALVLSLSFQPSALRAEGYGQHDMSHGNMGQHNGHMMSGSGMAQEMPMSPAQGMPMNQAQGMGTIQSVNSTQGLVNISHDPIPTLGWPAMTMDLPVTKRVDLAPFKAGDKVHFTLKKGRDNQFRIVSMMPAQ